VNAYTCAEWCMCTYIYIVLLRLIGSNCDFNSHLFSAKSQRAWKSVGTSLAASRHAGLFVLTDFKVTAERTRRHSFNSLSRSPLWPGRPNDRPAGVYTTQQQKGWMDQFLFLLEYCLSTRWEELDNIVGSWFSESARHLLMPLR